ncbi:hypothetical protein OG311_00880 [Streptomyces sp. NBC_01343]|uniref:hypothetical protein n=1 Tax=Streptomyces sp. NBC_01343 TaxID=2903832 RepID=UPI002E0F9EF9|nr:hypothetical protein OG311_00880 [Streptomyces sp. NBC_01343]
MLLSDSVTNTVHGRVATHTGTPGVTASQAHAYDNAGRLTQTQDTGTDAICTTRTYTFDKNTNRKSRLNHYDSEGDSPRWAVEDTALAPTVLDSDEYGNARAGQAAARYSRLGGRQRSDETLTGLTLMGVRLHDPSTGRSCRPTRSSAETRAATSIRPIRSDPNVRSDRLYRVYRGWSWVTITLNSRASTTGALPSTSCTGPDRTGSPSPGTRQRGNDEEPAWGRRNLDAGDPLDINHRGDNSCRRDDHR